MDEPFAGQMSQLNERRMRSTNDGERCKSSGKQLRNRFEDGSKRGGEGMIEKS
jgi:hypothetical protein